MGGTLGCTWMLPWRGPSRTQGFRLLRAGHVNAWDRSPRKGKGTTQGNETTPKTKRKTKRRKPSSSSRTQTQTKHVECTDSAAHKASCPKGVFVSRQVAKRQVACIDAKAKPTRRRDTRA